MTKKEKANKKRKVTRIVNGFGNDKDCFYLAKLSRKFKGKEYYGGYTQKTVKERFTDHESGKGCAFLRAAQEAGITYKVIFTVPRPENMYYLILEWGFKEARKYSKFDILLHGEKAQQRVEGLSLDEQKNIHIKTRGKSIKNLAIEFMQATTDKDPQLLAKTAFNKFQGRGNRTYTLNDFATWAEEAMMSF
jgi:predicted GIY-YIG superfamily endonuclease